jgi:hypothetical protein
MFDNKIIIFCIGAAVGILLMAGMLEIAPTDGIRIVKMSGVLAGCGLLFIVVGFLEHKKKEVNEPVKM